MTPNEFRRLALKMDGAVEGAHMGHPDFRANRRIFATLYPDGESGMVKLTFDQQQDFIGSDSAAFAPASGPGGVRDAQLLVSRRSKTIALEKR